MEAKDLLSEELVETEENVVAPPVNEPVVKKDGRSKKERTPAQIAAFEKARQAYKDKRIEFNKIKDGDELKKAEVKVEMAKQKVKDVAKKKNLPIPKSVLKEEEEEPKKDEEVDSDKEEKTAKQRVLKERKKKEKALVVVEQNSDSESEDDQQNIIYIKRRPKKKVVETPVEPPPIVRQPNFNPFAQPYFIRPDYR